MGPGPVGPWARAQWALGPGPLGPVGPWAHWVLGPIGPWARGPMGWAATPFAATPYGGGPFVLAPDPTLKDQPGDETHRAYPNVSDPRYIVFFLDVLFSENKSPC